MSVLGLRDAQRSSFSYEDAAGGKMAHGCTSRRGASPREAPTIEALIEVLDPDVRAAIDDVDRSLIALSLQRSPWGSADPRDR
ncbi:MAG TPA: hypothetical protein VFT22_36710 [Kofleriaceae bacterium]|nr:hypothetical protein [Kofleriaceae bacterium]